MGFDVLYLPPIHPIGRSSPQGKKRLGPGRLRRSGKSLGDRRRSRAGTKRSTRELGTLEDFDRLVAKAPGEYGLEIAMDLAYQCSPDHPYV